MNVRELKRLLAVCDESPSVELPSGVTKRLLAVAIAADVHVEQRGAWKTELGQAVEQLRKGNGS